jgi:hypothetical protein
MIEDLLKRRAGPRQLGRQPVDARVALVANYQPLLGVEHGEALGHVVEGRVEAQVLPPQFLLTLLELGDVDAHTDGPAIHCCRGSEAPRLRCRFPS